MDKVYCYPDTSILKNKLDIHDKDRLLMAETSLVAVRLYQLYKNPIRGSFDYKHLCRIHHHIFQDLYSCPEEFIHVFTGHYADLNALHPFREGNGRSQREFARELCLKCGYAFDLRQTNHEEMLSASIESLDKGSNAGLEAIFQKCIMPLS